MTEPTDGVAAQDKVTAQLERGPRLGAVSPCPHCGRETRPFTGNADDGRRVCTARCKGNPTIVGSFRVYVDDKPIEIGVTAIAVAAFKKHIGVHAKIPLCEMAATKEREPLSPVARSRVTSIAANERPVDPCPKCGQESKAGSEPGARICVSSICRYQFGLVAATLDETAPLLLAPGNRYFTQPFPPTKS